LWPPLERAYCFLDHAKAILANEWQDSERRATSRRGAIPGVVVRGSVRVMTAVKSREQVFSVEEVRPRDYQRWRELRHRLQQREEARRQQWRFRKNPAAYLADIEARLLA